MDTTALLARIRQAAQLPDDDEDWTDSEILAEATQALYERFAQAISVLRNGYWLHRVTQDMVNGQAMYRLPSRAIVQGLEKIEWSSDTGNSWKDLHILTDVEARDYSNTTSVSEPQWFSLESDCVVLYPTPSSSSFLLRFSYYLRPSVLVPTVTSGVVVGLNAPGELIVSGDPTFLDHGGGTLDVVNTTGCNEVAIVDLEYDSIVSFAFGTYKITFDSSQDVTRLLAGQVVRTSDQTDQIPLPIELHAALVARTAAVVLAAKGDNEKSDRLAQKSEGIIKRITDAAIPRIKSKPYTWKTRNTYLRRRVGFGIGWR